MNCFAIVFTVPETHADAVREAACKAGAGRIGEYAFCSFSLKGTGRFLPLSGANPFLGAAGKLETVSEERIETICPQEALPAVLDAIRKAHPYEEPYIYTFPVSIT